MTRENHDNQAEIQDAIKRRQSRREAWEKEGERPLWKNLSMVGALGWLVVVPTLIGVFLGRWLDGQLGTGVTFSGAPSPSIRDCRHRATDEKQVCRAEHQTGYEPRQNRCQCHSSFILFQAR